MDTEQVIIKLLAALTIGELEKLAVSIERIQQVGNGWGTLSLVFKNGRIDKYGIYGEILGRD